MRWIVFTDLRCLFELQMVLGVTTHVCVRIKASPFSVHLRKPLRLACIDCSHCQCMKIAVLFIYRLHNPP